MKSIKYNGKNWPDIIAAAAKAGVILDCDQRTPDWFRGRLGVPTSSRFKLFHTPATDAYSSKKTRTGYMGTLLAERFLGLAANPQDVDSFWMHHGRVTEARARAALEMHLDRDITEVGMILNFGAGASPDGIIGGEYPCELKCPKASTHMMHLIAGVVPNDYKPQVHGHMVIMEVEQAIFQSYYPGLPDLIVPVKWDDYTDKLAANLQAFNGELAHMAEAVGAPAVADIPWTD